MLLRRAASSGGGAAARLSRLIGALGFAFWIIAALLRLTLRDRLPLLSVLFYGTPPAILAISALLGGVLLFLGKSRRLAVVATAAGLLCGLWWWQASFFYHESQTVDDGVQVLFWNCRRGYSGWKPIAEEIHRIDVPLVGLVEANAHNAERREFWRWEFVDYDVATPGGGIVLMTRGEILRARPRPLADVGRCGEFEVELDGRRLWVIVVDITSNPFVSREPAYRALLELIDSHQGEPLLVMGDFNTPTESIYADELRRVCRHAFETAGSGYASTWPLPVPVLPLDQVWINDRLHAADCRHLWTSNSDHRPVVATLSILPAAAVGEVPE